MGKRFRQFLPVLLILVTSFANLHSQEKSDPAVLTLERIFDSREFAPARFGPARWMKDGKSYTTVEDSAAIKGGKDIVLCSAETGKREVLIPASRLVSPGETTPLLIDNYEWSASGAGAGEAR